MVGGVPKITKIEKARFTVGSGLKDSVMRTLGRLNYRKTHRKSQPPGSYREKCVSDKTSYLDQQAKTYINSITKICPLLYKSKTLTKSQILYFLFQLFTSNNFLVNLGWFKVGT